MDELEQYYRDDFCIEADVLYDQIVARLKNKIAQLQYKTRHVVKLPEDFYRQTLEARAK